MSVDKARRERTGQFVVRTGPGGEEKITKRPKRHNRGDRPGITKAERTEIYGKSEMHEERSQRFVHDFVIHY